MAWLLACAAPVFGGGVWISPEPQAASTEPAQIKLTPSDFPNPFGAGGNRAAQGYYVPIDISAAANTTWTSFPGADEPLLRNGSTFPTGSQLFGGVPFQIPTSNNAWSADMAKGGKLHAGTAAVTIPINVYGVSAVYTLLNTEWGQSGASFLSVTFTGSGGAAETFALMGNADIRDYNQSAWTNSISGTTEGVWQNGLGQRLDRQQFILAPIFQSQTLLWMTITDSGDRVNVLDPRDPATHAQRAFLSGVTVSIAIPEPGTLALLAGILGLGFIARLRSDRADSRGHRL